MNSIKIIPQNIINFKFLDILFIDDQIRFIQKFCEINKCNFKVEGILLFEILNILNNIELIKTYHFYVNAYYEENQHLKFENSDLNLKIYRHVHFKTILGKYPKETREFNNCMSECQSVQWTVEKLQDKENFVHILLSDDHFEIIEKVDRIEHPNINFIIKNRIIK